MNKKKIVIILIVCVFVIILLTNTNENLRIRVISNSDTYEDRLIKADVVKIVQKYIKATDTKKEVQSKLNSLNLELSKYSEEKALPLIEAVIEKTEFPPKTLDEKVIPGGVYETLLIKIGKAEGKNYWTILYPEYYGITFEDINSGDVEVKWFFIELFR